MAACAARQSRRNSSSPPKQLASTSGRAAIDTTLTTASFTPRVKINSNIFGLPTKAIGGFDYYRSSYDSDRPMILGAAPIHHYDLTQSNAGFYWQQTVSILPTTDISAGGRIQQTKIHARDAFDAAAPGAVPLVCFPPFGCFGDQAGIPLDNSETNRAYHLGAEHRFNENFAVFGRMAQSFRVPNVDERVGTVTALSGIPVTVQSAHAEVARSGRRRPASVRSVQRAMEHV